MKVMLVTGGTGFIGSNFIKYFLRRNKDFLIANVDKLTYASNPGNLRELEGSPRYHFIKGDICNHELMDYILSRYRPDYIVNFAGETDAERSIDHPAAFVSSNIMGTLTLLEGARYIWSKKNVKDNRFVQVSTDQVYGAPTEDGGYCLEESPLVPENPFSASKAGADLIVKSYSSTYGMPTIITRCCNTYGPMEGIGKFVPSSICSAMDDKAIYINGDGSSSREWMYVIDHCVAIIRALFYGKPGETYNFGTDEQITDYDLAKKILKITGKSDDRIELAKDRPVIGRSPSLNSYKACNNLHWNKKYTLDEGLRETITWYRQNNHNADRQTDK